MYQCISWNSFSCFKLRYIYNKTTIVLVLFKVQPLDGQTVCRGSERKELSFFARLSGPMSKTLRRYWALTQSERGVILLA